MKKAFSLVLVLVLVVSLMAGLGSTVNADDTVYHIRFASNEAEGSPKNLKLEIPLKEMLYEKSGGRIEMEIFSSGTLASNTEIIDALTSGICEIAMMTPSMFQGQFPYSDLIGIPGLYYGDVYETDEVFREYVSEFVDKPFQGQIKDCLHYSVGSCAIITTKPISSLEDLRGMTARLQSSSMAFYEQLGMVGVSMSAADQYEGLKLGTIDATITNLTGFKSRKLAEVTVGLAPVPVHQGDVCLVMSQSYFDSLPEDIQAIFEETFEELYDDYSQCTTEEQIEAIKDALLLNPDFQVYEFSEEDLEALKEAGKAGAEAKAAELDAMGLDGTGALQFLRDHAK